MAPTSHPWTRWQTLLLVALTGCRAAPPEAPTDLGELSLFLFDEIDSEDSAAAAQGALNLRTFFLAVEAGDEGDAISLEASTAREDRTWSLPPLAVEWTEGATLPATASVDRQLPVGVAFRSVHPMDMHSDLIALPDQTPVEPESSSVYDRSFETDVDCFIDGTCDRLVGRDTVHRLNFLIDVVYEQEHEWLRVELPDGSGTAILARTWLNQLYEEEGGGSTIEQWTSTVIHLQDGDQSLRFTTVWGSSSLNDSFADNPEFLVNQVADGIEEGYVDTDAYLSAR